MHVLKGNVMAIIIDLRKKKDEEEEKKIIFYCRKLASDKGVEYGCNGFLLNI